MCEIGRLGGMENGFKHVTSVTKPIHDAADLEGFRIPAGSSPQGRRTVANVQWRGKLKPGDAR
jgi:TRAP-type C4-dicarboxylate transport system substrate-binding protein